MEVHTNRPMLLDSPRVAKRPPAMRWVKEWITQDLIATGGKVRVQKWIREDKLKALNEKLNTPEPEAESEPTTGIEFFCTFEGCGKTFTDVGTLKKHTHVHGEKQHVCTYPGCGKKFLDSSKLKRHYLIHTGARDYVCPHEGCGKAFSLDFNLRAHMKTHSLENYHICPYGDCGKRFAHDYKLQAHIKAHHEKSTVVNNVKNTPPEKSVSKPPAPVYASASSDRPYACPYKGCDKAYIHEYKLNLHLKKEHPHHSEENGRRAATVYQDVDEAVEHDAYIGKNGYRCPYNGCGKSYIHEYKLNLHLRKEHPAHNIDENVRRTPVVDQDVDEMGEQEAYIERNGFTCPYEGCGKSYIHEYKLNLHLRKEHSGRNTEEVERRLPLFDLEGNEANGHSGCVGRNSSGKSLKRSKPSSSTKTPPSKLARNGSAMAAASGAKRQWSTRETYEEDSEETEEEDHENADEDGWAYQGTNEDDEETEDEE